MNFFGHTLTQDNSGGFSIETEGFVIEIFIAMKGDWNARIGDADGNTLVEVRERCEKPEDALEELKTKTKGFHQRWCKLASKVK